MASPERCCAWLQPWRPAAAAWASAAAGGSCWGWLCQVAAHAPSAVRPDWLPATMTTKLVHSSQQGRYCAGLHMRMHGSLFQAGALAAHALRVQGLTMLQSQACHQLAGSIKQGQHIGLPPDTTASGTHHVLGRVRSDSLQYGGRGLPCIRPSRGGCRAAGLYRVHRRLLSRRGASAKQPCQAVWSPGLSSWLGRQICELWAAAPRLQGELLHCLPTQLRSPSAVPSYSPVQQQISAGVCGKRSLLPAMTAGFAYM